MFSYQFNQQASIKKFCILVILWRIFVQKKLRRERNSERSHGIGKVFDYHPEFSILLRLPPLCNVIRAQYSQRHIKLIFGFECHFL